jgi:membrane protease subunit HflK
MREAKTNILSDSLDAVMRLLKVLMLLFLLLYLLSGMFIVNSDEVAFILRFGKLVGETTEEKTRKPGFHFALPRPFDQVRKLPVKKVIELDLLDFWTVDRINKDKATLDPATAGFCLTHDNYILRPRVIVRCMITDPENILFQVCDDGYKAGVLNIVSAEIIKAFSTFTIDALLSTGKKDLVRIVTANANTGIQRMGMGIKVLSVDLPEVIPPRQLKRYFSRVNAENINMQTKIKEARLFEGKKLAQSKSAANRIVIDAEKYAAQVIKQAESDTAVFDAIYQRWLQNPKIVMDEKYYRTMMNIFDRAGKKMFVPVGSKEKIKIFLSR